MTLDAQFETIGSAGSEAGTPRSDVIYQAILDGIYQGRLPPGSVINEAALAQEFGASRGPVIGHVSPEAASGGPIGLIAEGDTISINIPAAGITLEVDDAELARRRAAYVPREPNIKTGWLSRYARMVASANEGAVMK